MIIKGQIDRIEIRDNRLYIFGWAATRNAGVITDIQLSINHKIQFDFDKDINYASPDVNKVLPHLDHTENCRFAIHFPVGADSISKYQNALFEITPVFEKGAGWRLFHLYTPTLPIPEESLITAIGGNFNSIGLEYLTYFTELAKLSPNDTILDVGCGVGRMAYILAYYLDHSGHYEGFDIMPDVINWAQKEITPRHPNFKFQHIPIHNQRYFPAGTILGKNVIYPFQENHFDLAILTSVFTHIQGTELRRNLSELFRVIKPGGICFCTCFLLNEESEALIEQGVSSEPIRYEMEDCVAADPDDPENVLGYKENTFIEWISDAGFTLKEKYYGNWCKRKESVSFQDILILERK